MEGEGLFTLFANISFSALQFGIVSPILQYKLLQRMVEHGTLNSHKVGRELMYMVEDS
ncbi:hypothetical protein FACS1894111_13240 [Clostridia bacterium]|nr:hypothetical protein FACS1894111_13240 [Clostridia bacterium]